ncbi:MAG: zinc ABC transporter substrate-binding protein [Desulfobulbaceae bacterium]|uniref:Zinc ABC transporter substrate-binding protein n=1 Tax=Candidatus Desulfatifera sulfidica TaxID=2841691 RepID=A0A8J6TE56_9BACT|nr:zinc ABC transporter substrate-binding protein [Candidatus Desulfatifera sulfidica]
MRSVFLHVCCVLLAFVSVAVSQAAASTVFVSIPPQAALVEAIGGSGVTVHVLLADGSDPHHFFPTPKQVQNLLTADCYLTVDLEFERRLRDRLAGMRSDLRLVDMSSGVPRLGVDEGHGSDHDADPHLWLGFDQLSRMAENVAVALSECDPQGRAQYQAGLVSFQARLAAVQEQTTTLLRPHQGETLFVFHPAFGYLANNFQLQQRAVQVEGKNPSPRQLLHFIRQAQEEEIRVLFVQPQFDPRSAQIIADATGARIVAIDPLARDVLANITSMAEQLAQGLAKR